MALLKTGTRDSNARLRHPTILHNRILHNVLVIRFTEHTGTVRTVLKINLEKKILKCELEQKIKKLEYKVRHAENV